MTEDQERNNYSEVQTLDSAPSAADPQLLQTISHIESAFIALGILPNISTPVITDYDTKEDFDWFTSGKVETDSFKGKHIALWKKQIVGSGDTPLEAERIAKANNGTDCRPAVVYIPKDEEVDTIF